VFNGVATNYLLDLSGGLSQVLRTNPDTGGVNTWYWPGLDIIGQRLETASGMQDYSYFGYDGLDSVRFTTSEDASLTSSAVYDPYGAPLPMVDTTSASLTNLGFTGEQTDPTGLQYLRARYYNPELGMFTGLDPVEGVAGRSASRNGYGYVEGNPVNLTDASGRCPFCVAAAILVGKVALGALAGFAAGYIGGVIGDTWFVQRKPLDARWKDEGVRAHAHAAGNLFASVGAAIGGTTILGGFLGAAVETSVLSNAAKVAAAANSTRLAAALVNAASTAATFSKSRAISTALSTSLTLIGEDISGSYRNAASPESLKGRLLKDTILAAGFAWINNTAFTVFPLFRPILPVNGPLTLTLEGTGRNMAIRAGISGGLNAAQGIISRRLNQMWYGDKDTTDPNCQYEIEQMGGGRFMRDRSQSRLPSQRLWTMTPHERTNDYNGIRRHRRCAALDAAFQPCLEPAQRCGSADRRGHGGAVFR